MGKRVIMAFFARRGMDDYSFLLIWNCDKDSFVLKSIMDEYTMEQSFNTAWKGKER